MDNAVDASSYPDVRQLMLLSLLAETRSVSRTAEKLGHTQPSVSIALRQLRLQFGDPLFVRTKAGMQPTPRALELLQRAHTILDLMRDMASEIRPFDPRQSTRCFRICVPDSSHMTLMPTLLLHIRTVAPGLRLEALPVDKHTAEYVEGGEADLAIGGFVQGMEAGFYQQALFMQDFVCLVSAKHPRIQGELTAEAFKRESHIQVSYGSVDPFIEAQLTAQGVARKISVALPGFLGIARILDATDLVATVPRGIAEGFLQNFNLQLLRCPFQISSYPIHQYWHSRFHSDGGNKWLRQTCADLFGSGDVGQARLLQFER